MSDEIKEIKINKAAKSITFINNGIAFSQFGIDNAILDLITNLQEEKENYKSRNEKAIEYIKEWQRFPHTNGSTHNELKNLIIILGGDKE